VAPKNALGDIAAVKDQKLNKAVDEGKPVSLDDLVDKDQRGIEDRLQPGQRAIAIKVNPESLAGGLIFPGARVDILCTTRGSDASTSVILQSMLVLAVDAQVDRTSETKALLGQTVTLAATPEEAAKLTLGQSTGELRLMLKSDKDSRPTNHVVARKTDLQKGHSPDPRHSEPEPVRSTTNPAVPLPALPPDAVARGEEPKPKPKKPHVLIIRTGTSTERHLFHEGEEDDATASSPPARSPEPKKPEPKKPEPKGPAGKVGESGGKPTRSPSLPPMPGQ
jgi:Flp pilus assembly protein CpaB